VIYRFDHPHQGDPGTIAERVGGKGASLWAMSTQMHLPTPPGFTIGCDYCERYEREGLADDLLAGVETELAALGSQLGRYLGDRERPLLLAVRSGAPVSMPGMMETVLNVGLTPDTLDGLAAMTGSRNFALDSYQRFLSMYASCVLDMRPAEVHAAPTDGAALEASVATLQAQVEARIGAAALRDPQHLLRETIGAVFRSRNSAPARAYRAREGLPESMGTSVTVQAMVFGNLDADSGTGVVFTRDPSTGENRLSGDWMAQAQGEDVVAGIRATRPIEELQTAMPRVWQELKQHADTLEHYYRDMVDIEFTVERGRLWILQARVGKRSPGAAARIAVELAEEGSYGVNREEALARVPAHLLDRQGTALDEHPHPPLTQGLPASPGAASGKVVLCPDAAIDAAEAGEDVILVRRETSPADIHGMSAAVGVLTTLGGLMSHAAVVARDWGLPAVVGAEGITLEADGFRTGDAFIRSGELISIDGASGAVYRGALPARTQSNHYIDTLRRWASEAASRSSAGA